MRNVKMSKLILIFILLTCCSAVFASDGKALPCFDKLWKDASKIVKDPTGKTWRESGVVNMTWRSTVSHVENEMLQNGYEKKNQTEKEKNGKTCHVSLWRNRACGIQVIIMCLEHDVDETYFSWGSFQNGK